MDGNNVWVSRDDSKGSATDRYVLWYDKPARYETNTGKVRFFGEAIASFSPADFVILSLFRLNPGEYGLFNIKIVVTANKE